MVQNAWVRDMIIKVHWRPQATKNILPPPQTFPPPLMETHWEFTDEGVYIMEGSICGHTKKCLPPPPEELDPNKLGSLRLSPVPNWQLEIITYVSITFQGVYGGWMRGMFARNNSLSLSPLNWHDALTYLRPFTLIYLSPLPYANK